MTVEVFPDARRLGDAAAELILERVRSAGARPFLLGCPGGRSPWTTFQALATRAAREGADLSRLVIVMMDDYLESAGAPPTDHAGYRQVPVTASHSCRRFAELEILAPIERAMRAAGHPERAVRHENLWMPDPADPAAYDVAIQSAGGVDLFLLASGASDGHVAFNAPGASRDSRTRVVDLPETTRRDNLATFPSFGGDLSAVPTHGVTVGIETIRALSREVLMVVHGPDKQEAARRLVTADDYDSDWPATVLVTCTAPKLFLDAAAAAGLPGR